MIRFIKKTASHKIVPIIWTIITIGLLCIPGKAIPGLGLFTIEHLDKVAHLILFGGFVVLWSLYYASINTQQKNFLPQVLTITFISIFIGVVLEFVQADYIPNRSFDRGDIMADIIGSALAVVYIFFTEIKKSGKKSTHLS